MVKIIWDEISPFKMQFKKFQPLKSPWVTSSPENCLSGTSSIALNTILFREIITYYWPCIITRILEEKMSIVQSCSRTEWDIIFAFMNSISSSKFSLNPWNGQSEEWNTIFNGFKLSMYMIILHRRWLSVTY